MIGLPSSLNQQFPIKKEPSFSAYRQAKSQISFF